ncbi:MAG TPA: hypothetical protein HPP87_13835 [Planctomycetes bacterium]|nr:hypothetical protein [Planctomycetota bacterium]
MSDNKRLKGPFWQRFFIIILSIVFGVLLFWLVGFITKDIGSLRGPEFSKVKREYVDAELLDQHTSIKERLNGIEKDIKNKRERQRILKDSSDNLQSTIDQLLSIQRQRLGKNLDLSEENQKMISDSQAIFLENQKQYQILHNEIVSLTNKKYQLEKEQVSLSKELDNQRGLARREYNKLLSKHRLKTAALKLGILLPIFLLWASLFIKKRSGAYGAIIYAGFIAVFLKVAQVSHEYFPRKYFKYIALLVIIGIVLKLLFYLLKMLTSPKKDWLIKQYQEAYDNSNCPICGKPIRIGPQRYFGGGRRRQVVLAGRQIEASKQQIYTCPVCGTQLYDKCEKCDGIRHTLLPFCEHCGSEKADSTIE